MEGDMQEICKGVQVMVALGKDEKMKASFSPLTKHYIHEVISN